MLMKTMTLHGMKLLLIVLSLKTRYVQQYVVMHYAVLQYASTTPYTTTIAVSIALLFSVAIRLQIHPVIMHCWGFSIAASGFYYYSMLTWQHVTLFSKVLAVCIVISVY
jgi:hypothetical protein